MAGVGFRFLRELLLRAAVGELQYHVSAKILEEAEAAIPLMEK